MRYVGGKSKLAKRIAGTIAELRGDRTTYLEPFVGGGAVLAHVAPTFGTALASDTVPDLVDMWQAVASGWLPPETISREQYAELRHATPSALRGFVGFGGSFGGKWFGGYAAGGHGSDGLPRNHQAESRRALERMAPSLTNVQFSLHDYRDWTDSITPDVVVYADPPYQGTLGYGAAAPFDSAVFWETMAAWRTRGALVLVSEYQAPDGWGEVLAMPHRQTVQRGDRERFVTTERVWA